MSENQVARVPAPHPPHPVCALSSILYAGFHVRLTDKQKPCSGKHQRAQGDLDASGDVDIGPPHLMGSRR